MLGYNQTAFRYIVLKKVQFLSEISFISSLHENKIAFYVKMALIMLLKIKKKITKLA